MIPERLQDHSTLRWVRGELNELVLQARRILEDYAENPSGDLGECIAHLHRIHGTLEMVQVYGAAMLADEMEQLLIALDRDKVAQSEAAAEVLMSGLIQLPAYLEKVAAGEPDIPLILLPLMNDLRAARDAPLVSEISLFAPKLNAVLATEAVIPGSGNPALSASLREIRSEYHRGLLNWFRDIDPAKGLSQLHFVIERIGVEARTPRLRRLMDALAALVGLVIDGDTEASVAIKLLFGKLDRVFKVILDQGEEAAVRDFPIDLLKNVLYYVARANSANPVVLAVQHSAALANSFPDVGQGSPADLGAPGAELFAAVADALRQDLVAIKDELDIYIRGDRTLIERLVGLAEPLRRVGDTLGMVGRGELRAKLKHRCDQLHAIEVHGQAPADDDLMRLAADILFVESALAGLEERAGSDEGGDDSDRIGELRLSKGEFKEHVRAAIENAYVELSKTKDSILSYLHKPDTPQLLDDVGARIHVVAGALQVLGERDAATLLATLENFFADLAAGRRETPDSAQRDSMADLIVAIEYYLEAVVDGRGDRQEILEYAHSAVTHLGLAESSHGISATLVESAGADDSASLAIASGADDVSTNTHDGSSAAPIPDASGTESATAGLTESDTTGDAPASLDLHPTPVFEAIDDEIIEIFIEEAREVLETIAEQYPRWRDDSTNQSALQTVRRAFHTLKGSGRLVGAVAIGEFAWAIENLLNRLIDDTVAVDDEIHALLDRVVEVLPNLVDAYADGHAPSGVFAPLEAQAVALASGRTLAAERAADVEDDVAPATSSEAMADIDVVADADDLVLPTAEVAVDGMAAPDMAADDIGTGAGAEQEFDLPLLDLDEGFDIELGGLDAAAYPAEPTERLEHEADDEGLLDLDATQVMADIPAEDYAPDVADTPDAGSEPEAVDVAGPIQHPAGPSAPDVVAHVPADISSEVADAGSDVASTVPDDGVATAAEPEAILVLDDLPEDADTPAARDVGDDGAEADEDLVLVEADLVDAAAAEIAEDLEVEDIEVGVPAPDLQPFDTFGLEASVDTQGPAEGGDDELNVLPAADLAGDYEAQDLLADVLPDIDSDGLDNGLDELDGLDIDALPPATLAGIELSELSDVDDAVEPDVEPADGTESPSSTDDSALAAAIPAESTTVPESGASGDEVQSPPEGAGFGADADARATEDDGAGRGYQSASTRDESVAATIGLPDQGEAWQQEHSDLLEATSDLVGIDADSDDAIDLDSSVVDLGRQTAEQDPESILIAPQPLPAPIALESGLFDVFTGELVTHLATLSDYVEGCRGRISGCRFHDEIRRSLHTLRGSTHTAGVESMAALAEPLDEWVMNLNHADRRTDGAILDLLERTHSMLAELLAVINVPGAQLPNWRPLQRELIARAADAASDYLPATAPAAPGGTTAYDAELMEIFLEEARELQERIEQDFTAWQAQPQTLTSVSQLQRYLHTIKGGARLAGVVPLGNLSHAIESMFEALVERRLPGDVDLQRLARRALDEMASAFDMLERGETLPDMVQIIEHLEAAARGEMKPLPMAEPTPGHEQPDEQPMLAAGIDATDASEIPADDVEHDSDLSELESDDSTFLHDSQLLTDSELLDDSLLPGRFPSVESTVGRIVGADSRIIQFPGTLHRDIDDEQFAPRHPPPEEPDAGATNQERVRVSSELLDQMVNNAGEVSIYRARLAQQNNSLAFNLQELARTTDRLRTQLRDLELETEAQILSRHEREFETEALENFDPLEMDRYSTMQQLSRALSETVSDLGSLGSSLEELNRDTDTLLLQQERVTADLQDGLLRTRMVPFSSRVPRLQRVVRQTCHSLGKDAELDVIGGAGEMDRAILERMMGPLEHLLRNSIAHGIETPEVRAAAGKPAQGRVTLQMMREGSEVVLIVADDGAGLNRALIRAKAVEKGLLDATAQIDDDDLDQFILVPGLTTAESVSQVAGRGVGMDAVVGEVKQLGGTLEILSQPERGASFTIRLPFTLAIAEALLVQTAGEVYAIPYGSMDGVVRISRQEIEDCYTGRRDSFSYGGREYGVRYLGSMLGREAPVLPEGQRWFPVLLVRSGEHRVAVQVDELVGNRQIVVKSVGLQLSSIRWVTGGTILPNGRIALILDMNSLVRLDTVQHPPSMAIAEQEPAGITVMVVDDSITVRKVTSRLLERHNMTVITAKDGVDAVAVLQEQRPDVMLLDIEMPRMDGFELARHMRSSFDLADIPIIMITSRTGDKHRTHAMELGVKRYLGKPFQEAELLENIYTVLAEVAG